MKMGLNIKKVNNIIILYLRGRLDVHVSPELENEINSILTNEPNCHLLFDLTEVDYMSSSGLRIFVSTMRILNESRRELKLCKMNETVREIFKVIDTIDMFDIYPTEEEALKTFPSE
ncbi:MAG: STAS domain-containing protein [bacterium]|nr:STAS domain-containing protein [bacterium]